MYCRKCYEKLDAAEDGWRCPQCGRPFEPTDPSTYLLRPFPGLRRIVFDVVTTTLVGLAFAFVVAFFQLAKASGH